jgi:hypothetical protein
MKQTPLRIGLLIAVAGWVQLCTSCSDGKYAGTAQGFIRVQGHSLVSSDGKPIVAIGENRINIYDPSWNWDRLSIDEYIRHMADNGMTTLRVFIVSDIENEQTGGPNPGVLEPAVGRFNVDSDELMTPERARHYQRLREVLTDLATAKPRAGSALKATPPAAVRPVAASASHGVSVWALNGGSTAALWLLAPKDGYGSPVSHTRITIHDMPDGTWHVQWQDDVTGHPLAEAEARVSKGQLTLVSAPFTRQVVARLRLLHPAT